MLNWCERWAPVVAAAVAAAAALLVYVLGWGPMFSRQFDVLQVISVSFNVLAFATPVTIALFAITLAPGGGFIQKLFGTQTYAIFVNYVIFALITGILALLISAPFLISKTDSAASRLLSPFLPVWFGVASGAAVAIGRVLVIFLVWAKSYSRPKRQSRPELARPA